MIGILKDLLCQTGLGRFQSALKVGDGGPLAQVEAVPDLQLQGLTGPALHNGFSGVPFPQGCVFELGQQGNDVEPWQLVSRLLTKSEIGAILGEKPHVFEIACRQTLHVRKGFAQVRGEPFDHFGPPALARLPLQDFTSDIVIQANLLRISGQKSMLPGAGNTLFQAGKPVAVIGWQNYSFSGHELCGIQGDNPIWSAWAAY